MTLLDAHQPTSEAKAKAEAANLDLNDLKQTDPTRYMMLNASRLVTADAELSEMAASVFFAAFPNHELFQQELSAGVLLLAFPPLDSYQQDKYDDALARLAGHPKYAQQHAYFRRVTDSSGETRQFALPVEPSIWSGELNRLVGPFSSEGAAKGWAEGHVNSPLSSDTVRLGGLWFVDVFSG